jgi:hypothetical protein
MIRNSRESIIEDLRDLGVNISAILSCNPTDKQLRDMRDGLMKLCKATKVAIRYRTIQNKAIPVFIRE